MNELTKLQLSAEETAMVQDSHWLLTKNSIMQKAYELFGEASLEYRRLLSEPAAVVDHELLVQSPKISRGENYGGLPWVMLDYPRVFGKEDCFAIRTMFWWGNFLSLTWQIRGKYFRLYQANIVAARDELAAAGFQVCISEDEWRHDFGHDNYLPLDQLSSEQLAEIMAGRSLSKLAVKISLDQWNNAKDRLTELYSLILRVSGISSRGGETGP